MINYEAFNNVDIYDININAWTTDTLSVARSGQWELPWSVPKLILGVAI